MVEVAFARGSIVFCQARSRFVHISIGRKREGGGYVRRSTHLICEWYEVRTEEVSGREAYVVDDVRARYSGRRRSRTRLAEVSLLG